MLHYNKCHLVWIATYITRQESGDVCGSINQPESAILGTGGISDRVVVRDEKIIIRPILTYYFTYDHRVIDGSNAAKFMRDVQKAFEQPGFL